MDYQMISVDDHVDLQYLPRDLRTSRLPEQLRGRGPHVEETDSGYVLVCDGKRWGQLGWRNEGWPTPLIPELARVELEDRSTSTSAWPGRLRAGALP